MRGCDHLVGNTPTSDEAISRMKRLFMQLSGRRFCTAKDPDD
jgi:hypothetical protein